MGRDQTGLFQTVKDISVAELRANTTMLRQVVPTKKKEET
jgi:hypothetical protein